MEYNQKITASLFLGLSICLTGCGISDEEANNKEINNAKPMGYYSNEHHERNNGGNARILDNEDNDGPLVEMMDHTLGEEGQTGASNVENVNDRRQTRAETKEEITNRGNRTNVTYDNQLAKTIDQKSASVKNIKDAHSLVYGNNVLLAVQMYDKREMDATKKRLEKKITPYAGDKNISIITDQGIFSGIEEINKKIREGKPNKTITNNIEDIFEQLNIR
ncbi:YhcN/YlaJ family sporulation lipoprotein [Niallia sp. NCCP-28]|uniref:YhcN/YlaJ family sporulation lipoprotein n=1 Tax=Niallia sp. NCCP-28 TaxID=2934712 RepID=UPI00208CEE6E|nr:YhcN/YlaJ family sporulation lipoprotein [Niallia sp. NCCP-28]GKU81417.1 sporulation cortex protein CoxA [Niallia sp. NCCP-28]